jgi:hypothetical protein
VRNYSVQTTSNATKTRDYRVDFGTDAFTVSTLGNGRKTNGGSSYRDMYIASTAPRRVEPAAQLRAHTDMTEFQELKRAWKTATVHLSNISAIVSHPAYQQIIGMGEPAIWYILAELQRESDHWFWALKSITREDPVRPRQRGRMREMTRAWLDWGKRKGYLRAE